VKPGTLKPKTMGLSAHGHSFGGGHAQRLAKGHFLGLLCNLISVVWRFRVGDLRLTPDKGAGPCATATFESRQVRKEATVRRPFCVPQDHLAPV